MDWAATTVTNVNTGWDQYFQNAYQADPKLDYKRTNHSWCKCSENGIDFEITEEEKQRYITFLQEIFKLYDTLQHWPTTEQKLLVLAVARIISLNEQTFTQINNNGTYNSLVKMAEITKISTSTLVKVRYIDMLCSFIEHDAGLKWLLETKHWTGVWDLVMECQDANCDNINETLYKMLSKFLEKTAKRAPKICQHVIKQMVQPLISTSDKNYPKTKKEPITPINIKECKNLPKTMKCLIEIMERLLASNNYTVSETLKYFLQLKIRESCETLAILSNNNECSLQLNRILTMLCYFEMTEIFDGIKVVNQDLLILSGFFKILEREMKKQNIEGIYELLYYAQKYWNYVSNKAPTYFQKDKPIDVREELTIFQLQPIMLLVEKLILKDPFYPPGETAQEELLRNIWLGDVLNAISKDCLQLGYDLRKEYVKAPLESELSAFKCIIKSKPFYSRKNIAQVFQGLFHTFKNFIRYIKEDIKLVEVEHNQLLAVALLEATLVYFEDIDLSWRESMGSSLELNCLNYEFFMCSTKWNSDVLLLVLKILNITISRNLTTNMVLLLDYNSEDLKDLNELGMLLFEKCASTNVNIRETTMSIVCTICQKINEGFASFKQVLLDYLTPNIILAIAINDSNHSIRATALTCLQEMIKMKEFQQILFSSSFINKILEVIPKELNPMALKLALKFVREIFENYERNTIDNLVRVYKVMSKAAIEGKHTEVQEEAVKFWESLTRINLEKQGMIEDSFPKFTFSKEYKKIIRLNEKEIRKRILQALDDMSKTGCFNVFLQILEQPDTPKQIFATIIKIITQLKKLFKRYDVTPEFISSNQTYPNLLPIESGLQSPASNWMENDANMEELIEETVMEMIDGDINEISLGTFLMGSSFNKTEDFLSLIKDPEDSIVQISTVDFIYFIYKKLPSLIKLNT